MKFTIIGLLIVGYAFAAPERLRRDGWNGHQVGFEGRAEVFIPFQETPAFDEEYGPPQVWSASNDEYGVPHEEYGPPQIPHDEYGPPSTTEHYCPEEDIVPPYAPAPPAPAPLPLPVLVAQHDEYGVPHEEYGPPQIPHDEYGPPQIPHEEYGPPPTTTTTTTLPPAPYPAPTTTTLRPAPYPAPTTLPPPPARQAPYPPAPVRSAPYEAKRQIVEKVVAAPAPAPVHHVYRVEKVKYIKPKFILKKKIISFPKFHLKKKFFFLG